jgi:hypothetical protein
MEHIKIVKPKKFLKKHRPFISTDTDNLLDIINFKVNEVNEVFEEEGEVSDRLINCTNHLIEEITKELILRN